MEAVINAVVYAVQSNNYLLVLIVSIIAILFKFDAIMSSLKKYKQRRLEILEEMMEEFASDEQMKLFVQSEILVEKFRLLTGFILSKSLIYKYTASYNGLDCSLSFKEFVKAKEYFVYKDGELIITFLKLQLIWPIYAVFAGLVFIVAGLLFMHVEPSQVVGVPIVKLVFQFLFGLFLFVFGFIFILQLRPLFVALTIRNDLKKQSTEKEISE